ncbi:phosphotransferase [Nocardia sp. NPDC050717]|uniref:phosphotransferase n=1 Tax=Nocardia sp. NPDC050717 TaxID=3157221 RepID=UPI0033E12949
MSAAAYVKNYPTPQLAEIARAHHEWLLRLEAPVRVPQLREVTGTRMALERLEGHHPRPDDLPVVAAALGALHTVANIRYLHAGRLDRPFEATPTLTIGDFTSPRVSVLPQDFEINGLPCALYKDSNIRNFILTDDHVGIIDFDDLTLAPFGYDLAKLVVSTAMTHGHLSHALIENALDRYNSETTRIPNAHCDLGRLQLYADIHHHLTSRYLGRHGYAHQWPAVHPWPRGSTTQRELP